MTQSTLPLKQPGGPRQQRQHTPKAKMTDLYQRALVESFRKLDPRVMVKNPVMFVVWVGTVITAVLTVNPTLFGPTDDDGAAVYNGLITLILFLTVLFANFAEAVAEGRGKAQADALRSTRSDTTARRLQANGSIEEVNSTSLKRGDRIKVIAGDMIPADGEVMDRVAQFNVVATSGRAVEACGDINTLVLDKTGTITLGNRLAEEFIPVNGHSEQEVAAAALAASVFDTTPEGKSIVRLAEKLGATVSFNKDKAEGVKFSARTRMSGTDLPDGSEARKGAVDAIRGFVRSRGGQAPAELDQAFERVSRLGGTPLAVCRNSDIYLKDIIKPGIRERFDQLRRMGVRTVMLTGDNRITASVIAEEAGVDDFVAEATPEDKIQVIQAEQAQGKLVAMTGDGTNDAPALAQANVGVAMNSGTQAAKEAANMVDLDSDPTKLIDLVTIGKQLLITRGALTTFSLANDIAKYFAIIPAMFAAAGIGALNVMGLSSPRTAVLSALIYNALIIPALIPLALKGIEFRPLTANQLLQRNILIYGLGGIIVPFVAIKVIDMGVSAITNF
jgi:K+-transporting ATPase ATPase B chain